ncbi:oligosaccharide flippase family protein [Variovorax boronicumulans]|uniref:oligosaccharide flippase family protein n=1 Tax=Variovorax boronicumulans TaxID=436515 RepID=UPI00142D3F6D|nr:oligosaccharide flippase family protein [Variovorax boronicumulans]
MALLSGKIGRAVAVVASGAVLGQVISVIVMPVVTRIYSPEAMGVQSVFLSVGNILATSAALTYPLALVLPKKNVDAAYLMILSVLLGMAFSVVALLFIFTAGYYAKYNFGELSDWAYYLPLYIFFSVLGVVSSQCLVREKRFKEIARASWELSAVLNVSKVIGGALYASPAMLIGINILSGLARFFLSTRFLLDLFGAYFQKISVNDLRAGLRKISRTYRDFPIYRAPQAIIAAFSQSLPLIIISLLFDAGVVGQFALALTVLSLPVNFIGAAVAQVIYPIVNDALRAGKEISGDVIRITLLMGLIGAPVFAGVAIFGGHVFEFVFGENWALAGRFSQWLALFMFMDFISRPSIAVIPVLGYQQSLLVFEVGFFAIKSAVLFVAFYVGLSSVLFVAIYSVSCAFVALLQISWAIRASYSSNFIALND